MCGGFYDIVVFFDLVVFLGGVCLEGGYSLYVIPLRRFDVPEVLEVQPVPSEEVRIVPELPIAIKVLFLKVTFPRRFEVPEVLEVHVVPSEEVRMVPDAPTTTKVLFP